MLYRLARHLRFPKVLALLVCVLLFLLSELTAYPYLHCCGYSMDFPFLCLGIFLSIFSIISFLCCFTSKKGDVSLAASRGLFQHRTRQILSEYFRGWFFVTVLLGTTLVLLGAALLFSLRFCFTWSVLALGCLSVLAGLDILLLDGYHRSA